MHLVLKAIDPQLITAWTDKFKDQPTDGNRVTVVQKREDIFENLQDYDQPIGIVSPANSFGFMDGGIDALYTSKFGNIVQQRIQQHIAGYELPIGCAVCVKTDHEQVPYCISAPTMRTPVSIKGTCNAYLAFSAALREAERCGLRTVLCPGLGTGIGRLPAHVCAKQMKAAWERQILKKTFDPATLGQASIDHLDLCSS